MKLEKRMKSFVALLLTQVSVVQLITVSQDLKADLEKIVQEFKGNPTDRRYHHEIQCGPRGLYSVLIWSPIEIFGCVVKCKDHPGTHLVSNMLTDTFCLSNQYRNPRYGTERRQTFNIHS